MMGSPPAFACSNWTAPVASISYAPPVRTRASEGAAMLPRAPAHFKRFRRGHTSDRFRVLPSGEAPGVVFLLSAPGTYPSFQKDNWARQYSRVHPSVKAESSAKLRLSCEVQDAVIWPLCT